MSVSCYMYQILCNMGEVKNWDVIWFQIWVLIINEQRLIELLFWSKLWSSDCFLFPVKWICLFESVDEKIFQCNLSKLTTTANLSGSCLHIHNSQFDNYSVKLLELLLASKWMLIRNPTVYQLIFRNTILIIHSFSFFQ